jgi:hypothetical protein
MIKCLILKNGVNLISEIIELGDEVDSGEPDCRLVNPFQISSNEELNRWPTFTDQRSLMISSESVITIVEPSQSIHDKYKGLVL